MPHSICATLTLLLILLVDLCQLPAEEVSPDLSPRTCQKGELLFEDDFGEAELKPEWYGKHGTQWRVIDGILRGAPASQEFQQKRIAQGDAAHSGRSPAGRIRVPTQDCILLFRFKMSNGLTEAHFGFDDGKMGTQHLGRFIVSAKSYIAIQRDKNAKVKGERSRILVKKEFVVKPDAWHWMMLEVIGDRMTAQVSAGPVLQAADARFRIAKGHINLPARGAGGVIYYDNVRVWKAIPIDSDP